MTYNVINGTSGNDLILGTSDVDVIDGGDGSDTLFGLDGNDWLYGGADVDFLYGMDGDDWLYGGDGTDFLYGGGGNDILIGGYGADYLEGGPDATASYADSDSGVIVNLEYGAGWGGTAEGDVLAGIYNVSGSDYGDNLTGNDWYNTLTGGGGEDWLYGLDGDDTLDGGDGIDFLYGGDNNDTLKGGSGADELDGGYGTDTADYSDSFQSIKVSLQYGSGKGGDAEGDHLVDIENVVGGFNDDIIDGNSDGNVLNGMNGDDTLQGLEGADELWGGDGIDTASYEGSDKGVLVMLADNKGYNGHAEGDTFYSIENVTGSQHDDTLFGDDGANTLIGGLGQDTMYGQDGADVFKFLREKELGTSMATADYLGDFSEKAGDQIDLSGIDADPSSREPDAFTFIGNNVDFTGVGQVRYYNDGGKYGYVELNTTGDLAPDFYIEVNTDFTSMMSDKGFILV